MGGVCLNWGCIPSKALIHQAELFAARPGLEAMGVAVDAAGLDYAKVHAKSRQAANRSSCPQSCPSSAIRRDEPSGPDLRSANIREKCLEKCSGSAMMSSTSFRARGSSEA